MKHKKKLVFGIILLVAFMVGWKIKPVELVDDKLLIDLDTAIVEAGWGQEGNPDEEPGDQNPDDENPGNGGQQKPDEDSKNQEKEVIISVRGEEIFCDGVKVTNTSVLRNRITRKCDAETLVLLEDNYAEAHVYKEVFALVEEMQAQQQFGLSEIVK